MKTTVYYDCLNSIVLLNFTTDGGAIFRVRTEARNRVLKEMSDTCLHNNEVGGYAYNNENTFLKKIERVLKIQLYEESANRMKGLASDVSNALNDYKPTVHIEKRDVLAASRAAAERASTKDRNVKPEIVNNSDAQDKSNGQNVFRLAAIGFKEGIAEGITKIVRRNITNPIFWITENSKFKLAAQLQIR